MKSVIRAEIARPARQEQGYDVYLLFLKKGRPRPLYCLISVFSNKHLYNFTTN